jgi:DMSO/TMAO reductase YedYZ molybdopterin-dependent catalytic subunit
MTPRGTDWSLALLVVLLFATGVLTFFAGQPGDGWVFAVHDVLGFALAFVLLWKLRRVLPRLLDPRARDRHTYLGALAVGLVAAALVSGCLWSSVGRLELAGYELLDWHYVLGFVLTLAVVAHLVVRAKPIRRRDLSGRRQFLSAAGVAIFAVATWRVQRPLQALIGLPSAKRRFTGSYEEASFEGNVFPTTSWVADNPRPLDVGRWRLKVSGLVEHPFQLAFGDVDAGDELTALLDCTGGFYSTQRWSGITLARLLERASPLKSADHVRVVSKTGYRWSFALADAREFLLATTVEDEALSHMHGAPLRLVAPGRRGFQWVKWIVGVELQSGPDLGAPASTVWSSFTTAGGGAL